jgi:hypothetical protein
MRRTYTIIVSVDEDELDVDQAMDKRNLQFKMDAAWPLARTGTVSVMVVREREEPSSRMTDG